MTKIYKSYGVLAHEYRPFYSVSAPASDIYDKINVDFPFPLRETAYCGLIVTIDGTDYLLRDVLTNWGYEPALVWSDGKRKRHKILKVKETYVVSYKQNGSAGISLVKAVSAEQASAYVAARKPYVTVDGVTVGNADDARSGRCEEVPDGWTPGDEIPVQYWYAVLSDPEDNDWGTGSGDLDEAKKMVRKNPDGQIAVINDGQDPVCEYVLTKDDMWMAESDIMEAIGHPVAR